MDISKLGIVEIDEKSLSLDLTANEIEALADELVDYHRAVWEWITIKFVPGWGSITI